MGGLLDEVRVLVDLEQRRTGAVDLPPGGGSEITMTGKFGRAHRVGYSERIRRDRVRV